MTLSNAYHIETMKKIGERKRKRTVEAKKEEILAYGHGSFVYDW